MLVSNLSASGIARKLRGVPNRALGRLHARFAGEGDYARAAPVLCNSLPKSGTHLLFQILRALPETRYFNGFIASIPSRPYRERALERQLRMIGGVAPGEVVPAHLFHHRAVEEALAAKQAVHVFIYRDPRDVAISDMHHVTYRVPYHGLHPIFANGCACDEERITLAIKGAPERTDIEFPDIAERIGRYKRWIGHPDVCAVRFEDLRSERLPEVIRKIVTFYRDRSGRDFDLEAAEARSLAAIAPGHSPTFRSGKTEQWRGVFTPQQRQLMKDIAGPLLVELGYENDLDW